MGTVCVARGLKETEPVYAIQTGRTMTMVVVPNACQDSMGSGVSRVVVTLAFLSIKAALRLVFVPTHEVEMVHVAARLDM